jgi:hypothetical protein
MTPRAALILLGALWLTGCAEVAGRPDLTAYCRQDATVATLSSPTVIATPAYGIEGSCVLHSGIGLSSLLVGALTYRACVEQIASSQQARGAQSPWPSKEEGRHSRKAERPLNPGKRTNETRAQSSDQLERRTSGLGRAINHNEEQGISTWPTISIMVI